VQSKTAFVTELHFSRVANASVVHERQLRGRRLQWCLHHSVPRALLLSFPLALLLSLTLLAAKLNASFALEPGLPVSFAVALLPLWLYAGSFALLGLAGFLSAVMWRRRGFDRQRLARLHHPVLNALRLNWRQTLMVRRCLSLFVNSQPIDLVP
jgi:hypothetical protein